MSERKPLVIVHGDCTDGFCCHWLFHSVFGDSADYVFAKYGDPLPDVDGRAVYVADFSWKRPQMIELVRRAERVVILDHHDSAEKELAGLVDECVNAGLARPHIVFDKSKAGCRLVWDYLKLFDLDHPYFASPGPPVLVHYVEDADLWGWTLPYSKAVSAVVRSHAREIDEWDGLQLRLAGSPEPHKVRPSSLGTMGSEGEAILRAERQQVKRAVRNAVVMTIGGYPVRVVNATRDLQSDIGHAMADGFPFSATYFDDLQRGLRIWSFRSLDAGIHVGDLARRFGGGGHARAAGCERPLSEPLSVMAGEGGEV